jgi:pyruvate-formate lyase-activating enzyme
MGFTLEVLSLLIPGLVEKEQIVRIAELVSEVDSEIPFTLLAFFPTHEMDDARAPSFDEMMDAAEAVRAAGLGNLRLGNLGVFCKTKLQMEQAAAFGQANCGDPGDVI